METWTISVTNVGKSSRASYHELTLSVEKIEARTASFHKLDLDLAQLENNSDR